MSLKRPVVLDAANIAYCYGNDKSYETKGILLVANRFLKEGHKPYIVIEHTRSEMLESRQDMSLESKELMKQLTQPNLLSQNGLIVVARKNKNLGDDEFALTLAEQYGGFVISRDNFIKQAENAPDLVPLIKTRVADFCFSGDFFHLRLRDSKKVLECCDDEVDYSKVSLEQMSERAVSESKEFLQNLLESPENYPVSVQSQTECIENFSVEAQTETAPTTSDVDFNTLLTNKVQNLPVEKSQIVTEKFKSRYLGLVKELDAFIDGSGETVSTEPVPEEPETLKAKCVEEKFMQTDTTTNAETDKQVSYSNDVSKNIIGTLNKGTIKFMVPDIKSFAKRPCGSKLESPIKYISNIPWLVWLQITKDANNEFWIGVFLKRCISDMHNTMRDFKCEVAYTCRVVSKDRQDKEFSFKNVFSALDQRGYGRDFAVRKCDMLNPVHGFIKDDWGIIEIDVEVKRVFSGTISFPVEDSKFLAHDFCAELSSDEVYVANIPWKLNVKVNDEPEKRIGIFIECLFKTPLSNWRCEPGIVHRIVSHIGKPNQYAIENKAVFDSDKTEHGIHQAITTEQLLQPEAGYVKDGQVTFEIDLGIRECAIGRIRFTVEDATELKPVGSELDSPVAYIGNVPWVINLETIRDEKQIWLGVYVECFPDSEDEMDWLCEANYVIRIVSQNNRIKDKEFVSSEPEVFEPTSQICGLEKTILICVRTLMQPATDG